MYLVHVNRRTVSRSNLYSCNVGLLIVVVKSFDFAQTTHLAASNVSGVHIQQFQRTDKKGHCDPGIGKIREEASGKGGEWKVAHSEN